MSLTSSWWKSGRFRGAIALCAALSLSACASGPAGTSSGEPVSAKTPFGQVQSPAQKEGSVTWYSGASPDQLQATADAFTTKYGIKVNLVRIQSGPMTTRYASEAQSGKVVADVIMESDEAFAEKATSNQWLAPLSKELVPAITAWPTSLVHGSYLSIESIPEGLEYSTKAVPNAPTSFEDLLRPEFKGKLLLLDPKASTSAASFLYFLDKTYGDDFLRKLGAQQPTISPSAVPGLQSIAAGEGSAFAICPPGTDASLVKSGAPLRQVTPASTFAIQQFVGISLHAPHPNAARLFANFLMTAEGQQTLTESAAISPLGTTAAPKSLPKPANLMPTPLADVIAALPRIQGLMGIG